MRTGAFAQAALLSVKALRVYHEAGLLVPAVVDPATGYRAYSPAQLIDATIIRLLRDVGVSLQDIHSVLAARDTELLRKVLAERAEQFRVGLDAVARLVDDLSVEADTEVSGVTLRREPAQFILAVSASLPFDQLAGFLIPTDRILHEAALASGAVVDGDFGACYPPQLDDVQDVLAYLAITAPVLVPDKFREAGVRMDELPACTVAVLEHRGPLEGLLRCYRRLGTWVAFHATPAELPMRELYRTPLDGPAEDAAVDVLWPVMETESETDDLR